MRPRWTHPTTIALAMFCTTGMGCASIDTRGPARPVTPLPPSLASYYNNGTHPDRVTLDPVRVHRDYTAQHVRLHMDAHARPISMTWYAPLTDERSPLILLSPINGSDTAVVEGFAKMFARYGYHGVIVHRYKFAYHQNRGVNQVEHHLRSVLIRNREALDWLLDQPTVDPDRVATFGISYGAIVNATLAGVDPRARHHVFVMPGAPLPRVMHTSRERRIRDDWNRFRDDHQLTDQQLLDALTDTIQTDPIKLAKYIPRNNVLMVIALFDRAVGTEHSWALWQALDRPEVVVLPMGHYSAAISLPFLRTRVMHFYRDRFGFIREPPP
jgi:dienelactone hydrolase